MTTSDAVLICKQWPRRMMIRRGCAAHLFAWYRWVYYWYTPRLPKVVHHQFVAARWYYSPHFSIGRREMDHRRTIARGYRLPSVPSSDRVREFQVRSRVWQALYFRHPLPWIFIRLMLQIFRLFFHNLINRKWLGHGKFFTRILCGAAGFCASVHRREKFFNHEWFFVKLWNNAGQNTCIIMLAW